MTNRIRNSSQLVVLVLIIMISAFGCKSSKKAMEASKEKARIEQEAALRQQQEAEAKRKAAEEKEKELKQREAEAKLKEAKASTPKARLGEYFTAISSSPNVTSANNSVNEALTLFASPETPVLIVISEAGGQKDYDRPTTIKDYLNYLKDQKKNINTVSDLKFDSAGKIIELELRKPL